MWARSPHTGSNEVILPILSGPLRGARWIVGSGRRAFWLGTFERHFQKTIADSIGVNSVFYDIGANLGFYSLLAARCGSRVLAFEPLPDNVARLRRHARLNDLHIEIHEAAISNCDGFTGSLKASTTAPDTSAQARS